MTTLLGISGSLRRDSLNTALLRSARSLLPTDARLEVATLHGIPLYDGDLESEQGIPDAVQALKQRVLGCDGLILATPEYNNGVPGVFKNAIDWLSRPGADIGKVFGGRAVALVGASPGGFGTILAQQAWLPVLRSLGVRPWFGPKLMLARAGSAFDAEGQLQDEAAREKLREFLDGFVRFARD